MPHFLQDINFSLQYFDLGYLGFPNGLDGIPFSAFSVHAFSHNTVVTVPDFFGIDVVAAK